MKTIRLFLSTLTLFLFVIAAQSQTAEVSGEITDVNDKGLSKIKAKVKKDGRSWKDLYFKKSKYKFELKPGSVYIVQCSKSGYIPKSIEIDLTAMEGNDILLIELDFSLFEECDQVNPKDKTFTDPIAKGKVKEDQTFSWSQGYANKRAAAIQSTMRKCR